MRQFIAFVYGGPAATGGWDDVVRVSADGRLESGIDGEVQSWDSPIDAIKGAMQAHHNTSDPGSYMWQVVDLHTGKPVIESI